MTQQEELFCQEYVQHGDLKKSAEAAGIFAGPDNINAKKLISKQRVKNRITTLNVQAQIRSSITVDKVLQMIMETYQEAMSAQKFDAANKATSMLAEYLNLFKARTANHISEQNKTSEERLKQDTDRYAKAVGVKLVYDKEAK